MTLISLCFFVGCTQQADISDELDADGADTRLAADLGAADLIAAADAAPPTDVGKDLWVIEFGTDLMEDAEVGPSLEGLEIGRCEVSSSLSDCTGTPGEDASFVPLTSQDEVRVVAGPQGSVMLVFMVRTTGVHGGDPDNVASTDNPVLTLTLFQAENEVANLRTRTALLARGAWQVSPAGLFIVLDGLEDSLIDTPLRIEGNLEDKDGLRRNGQALFVASQ